MFLLPYLVFYGWFIVYPIFKGFIISLNEWSIGATPKFVGLKNYAVIHYRTENVCASCGAFERLTNGSARWEGRYEQALRDRDIVLEAAREQP